MLFRTLGATEIRVSALGLGAGSIGGDDLPEEEVETLLGTALDLGITLFDSARSYGMSEERLGRYLSHRRSEIVISTKGGYGIEAQPDWTGPAVAAGIDEALRAIRTDYLDIFHLHSCPKDVALREDIGLALERAGEAGKVRVVAYSGEGEALSAAVRSSRFGAVQCSVNLFDQANLEAIVPRADHGGVGVIAKRPLANAVWRHATWPEGDHTVYWERMHAMQIDPGPDGWLDLALRFSAFAPGVSSAIVGTNKAAHLAQCAEIIDKGPIEEDLRRRIETSFAVKNRGWTGKV
jgi:aryl-alcohol dehydrogenase-like predicted oxidoreductase